MQSNTARVALGALVVVVAVVLLIVLKDDGKSASERIDTSSDAPAKSTQAKSGNGGDKPKPAIPTIVIRNGVPVGGVAELSFDAGDRIRFKIDSDVSDEVHVHGYDISKDVEAGGSVGFDFPADIEGVFEAELESRGEQIVELTVNP